MSYPLVNPNPHFLIGDVCQVVGTTHEVIIAAISCNTSQDKDEHQWFYSVHVPKGSGLITAWWKANELFLVTPAQPHPIMQYQTRRTAMQTQTVPQPTIAHQTVGYPIGTILHGNNPKKGNLWIITVDNSFEASLLYDGSLNIVVPSNLYKRDRMSPGMRIADTNDINSKLVGHILPMWATALTLTTHKPSKPLLTKPSNSLPPGVLQQINKSFAAITPQKQLSDLGLTKPVHSYGGFQSINDEDIGLTFRDCPARKDSHCVYKPYYGFTDIYQYCIHCDHKKAMLK